MLQLALLLFTLGQALRADNVSANHQLLLCCHAGVAHQTLQVIADMQQYQPTAGPCSISSLTAA